MFLAFWNFTCNWNWWNYRWIIWKIKI